MNDVVISVKNVSKCFEMYEKPVHRLYQTLCAGKKKFYKEFWALKDINFEVRKGECVGIIGRNGAGKSTLLQIITGTLAPTTGEVKVSGRVAALLELGSGFNPEFTGRENVYLNGSILGLSKEEIDARYQAILDFADIGEFIDQPVKTYSSGMMVRLAFAVIAHVDADVLIVDEALSVGDAFFQQKCMRFLRAFMAEHTVLFVSHDTGAVAGFCQRGILLNRGSVELIADAKTVVQRYLKDLYAENQQVDGGSAGVPAQEGADASDTLFYRDMRAEYINNSAFRNDIEVFKFNPKDSFGLGGASVQSVILRDAGGAALSWIVGGEMVDLHVRCEAKQELFSPIIGFFIRDRLGQDLFGDNTYVTYNKNPLTVAVGQVFEAHFVFQMPFLAPGDYSLCVAVAEGSNKEHVQHQWINEALIIRSQSTSPASGLVGIPMKSITLEVVG